MEEANLQSWSVTVLSEWNNRSPKPRYAFTWDVETVINFLSTSDSNKIELKLLTYKLSIFLVLAGSARVHEIWCLDIHYLIRHSSPYSSHFSKVTKTAKKNKIRPPIKYLRAFHHIDLNIQQSKNIRNGENQLLLGTISLHKAVILCQGGWYTFSLLLIMKQLALLQLEIVHMLLI